MSWFDFNWNVWCFNVMLWLHCSSFTFSVFFMLTPERLSQKIQVPRTPWTQCFLSLFVLSQICDLPKETSTTEAVALASPTWWKTPGWMSVTVLGPSCYKLERAEASKDLFRHQKSKRQFQFWREGQHNTLKERDYQQVSEQKDVLLCVLVPFKNPWWLFTFDFCPKTQCETSGQGRKDGGAWSQQSGVQTARALLRVEQLIEILNVIWPTCAF